VRGTSACANTPPSTYRPFRGLTEHPGPVSTRTAYGVPPVCGGRFTGQGFRSHWVRACGGLYTCAPTPHLLRTPPRTLSPLPSTASPLSHPSPLAAPSCPSPSRPHPQPPTSAPPKAPLPAQLMSAASSPIALLEQGSTSRPSGARPLPGIGPGWWGASRCTCWPRRLPHGPCSRPQSVRLSAPVVLPAPGAAARAGPWRTALPKNRRSGGWSSSTSTFLSFADPHARSAPTGGPHGSCH